jgi:hypothetical protein
MIVGHHCSLFFKLPGVMPPNEVTETPIPNSQVVRHGTSMGSENYEGNFVVDDFVTASYERKFYPGQTAGLDEESFKASKMVSSGQILVAVAIKERHLVR